MRSSDRSRSSRGRDRRSGLAGRRTASYDVCSFVNVARGRNCRTNRDTAPSTASSRCAIVERVIRTRCCVRLRIRTVSTRASDRRKKQMKYSQPICKRLTATTSRVSRCPTFGSSLTRESGSTSKAIVRVIRTVLAARRRRTMAGHRLGRARGCVEEGGLLDLGVAHRERARGGRLPAPPPACVLSRSSRRASRRARHALRAMVACSKTAVARSQAVQPPGRRSRSCRRRLTPGAGYGPRADARQGFRARI